VKTANLGLRVLAAVFDSSIVSFAWLFIIHRWGHPDQDAAIPAEHIILSGFPGLLLMLGTAAYWILPEWAFRATPGKWLCNLRVASLDGGPISFTQSLKRNILRALDFFPFYLTGFVAILLTPTRQRLGDLWAKTIVVSRA
jgi:uncharacterized RDD family membrane protein YckC